MATYSIKPLCLAIVLAGAALPTQVMAGPSTSPSATSPSITHSVTAPVEMWDVIAPRADVSPVVSHVDVSPGQGFDAPGTVIPMMIEIPSRTDFKGPAHSSEIWDAVTQNNQTKAVGVSHIDIQPGTSFDAPASGYPATTAPKPSLIVSSAYTQTVSSPDA